MIDATKSPTPTWRKYLTPVVLAVLIVIAGYVVWNKELHHSSSNASSPTTIVTIPGKKAPAKVLSPATTVPGSIPISNRNPFGS
jgi:hypothetical protein